MQERRTFLNFIDQNDIPSSATPIVNAGLSISGNTIYIPVDNLGQILGDSTNNSNSGFLIGTYTGNSYTTSPLLYDGSLIPNSYPYSEYKTKNAVLTFNVSSYSQSVFDTGANPTINDTLRSNAVCISASKNYTNISKVSGNSRNCIYLSYMIYSANYDSSLSVINGYYVGLPPMFGYIKLKYDNMFHMRMLNVCPDMPFYIDTE